MSDRERIRAWFCREVLPLERALTRYVRRNWRVADDVNDLRQEIYELSIAGAQRELPSDTRRYVYTVARNHLINRAKRARIVSFELVADLESLADVEDLAATDHYLNNRDDLRRVQAGIDRLPPRCREVIRLRKVEGLSIQETAEQLGISPATVDVQTRLGITALADFMLGGAGRIVQQRYPRHPERERQS